MRITELAMKRYLPFTFNNIELLELNITSDIQNIIGSNGTGKSSLLREINPRPAIRTNYGAGGYKRIRLTQGNSEYQLLSDFSVPDKPHSFEKDGEELNQSGTTSVQEELVRRELGYTPKVHAVCYGEQRLSSMRLGLRETHLLTIHPCQMKLILDDHVKVEKMLRGFRSNLTLLYERRSALTSQMLDPTIRAGIQQENDQLTHEVATIVGSLHRLTAQRQSIIKTLSEYPTTYQVRTKEERNLSRSRYPLFKDISREQSLDELRSLTMSEISVYKTQQDASVRQIQALTAEINKYEQYIRQSDAQGAIDLLESTIQSLKSDITSLEKDNLDRPFDIYSMNEIPAHVNTLVDLISPFIGYTGSLPSQKEVSLLESKLDVNRRDLSRYERDFIDLQDRLSTLQTNLGTQIIGQTTDGCQECVLFRQYSTTVRRLQSEYEQVSDELRQVQRKTTRLTSLVDGRREKLRIYNTIVPQMQRLSSYLGEHRHLLIPLQGCDILSILRQNPSMIPVRIQSHYDRSRNHHLLKKKKEELERRTVEYERLKTPSEFGRQFLESMVVEKQSELETLRKVYDKICTDLSEKQEFLTLLTDYTNELTLLAREAYTFSQQERYETLRLDREICDRGIETLNTIKTKTVGRLSEIDRVLREQDMLSSRYQEIVENITRIESQMKEMIELEKGLSPTTGIPYRYMVQFINDLIECANVFISKVFSYPFEFVPLSLGDPLDYKFKMRVGDVVVPDISECSDAQKELAELTFRLAQIIQLKQSQFWIYLDECDKTFDHYHKQKLLDLLRSLVDDGIVSQMFMINHNIAMYSGMQDAEILVLNESNIILPPDYNRHVKITHY